MDGKNVELKHRSRIKSKSQPPTFRNAPGKSTHNKNVGLFFTLRFCIALENLEYYARVIWTTFGSWSQSMFVEWKQAAWTFCRTSPFVFHGEQNFQNYSFEAVSRQRKEISIRMQHIRDKLTKPRRQENWKHVGLNKIRARARGGSGKKFNIFLISRM